MDQACTHSRSKPRHPQALDGLWLFTLLEHGCPSQAYNVGSDEVISIAAIAHLVRDILAPAKPVHILGQANPGAARNRYVPDIRKAQQQLGLGVTVPLAEAIRRSGQPCG